MKMKSNVIIGSMLKKTASKYGRTQRDVAKSVGYANATTNGHFNGLPVSLEGAVNYGETFNDSEFSWNLAKEMLGLIGIVNGKGVRKEILALWVLQKRESNERKQAFKDLEIDYLFAIPPEELNREQQEAILDYSSEYADELLFEISQITSQLELLDMSFMDLMKMKIPEWEKKQWIGG